MHLRPATPQDIPALCALGAETFAETYIPIVRYKAEVIHAYNREFFSPEKIAEELAQENVRYFLAEAAGEAVGYTKIVRNGATLELSRLYLRKSAQGKGYGKLIFTHLRELAAAEGFRNIRLTTFERNLPAIAFYKRLGFLETGETKFKIPFEGELFVDRDPVMELRL